jgi:Spy/CpxP family protein refolding chaperone
MALAVVFLMVVAVGYAGAAEKKSADGDKSKAPSMERMEKMHGEMKALKKKKVCEALGFDEQGCQKITSIIDKYDEKRLGMMRSMRDDIKELRAAVKDKKDEVLKDLVEKIEQKHNALKAVGQEEIDELKAVLTVEQQAKYILFTADFHKEARKMMHDVRDGKKRDGKKEDGKKPDGVKGGEKKDGAK